MPSAFAVFRLMTNSNFVGACTGRSPAFSPVQNAMNVGARPLEQIHRIEAVGDEAAAPGMKAKRVHRRQAMPDSQGVDALAGERVGRVRQRAGQKSSRDRTTGRSRLESQVRTA